MDMTGKGLVRGLGATVKVGAVDAKSSGADSQDLWLPLRALTTQARHKPHLQHHHFFLLFNRHRLPLFDHIHLFSGPPPMAPSTPASARLASPLRHHRRTPSADRRPVKETLNARLSYEDDEDGNCDIRINQYGHRS